MSYVHTTFLFFFEADREGSGLVFPVLDALRDTRVVGMATEESGALARVRY